MHDTMPFILGIPVTHGSSILIKIVEKECSIGFKSGGQSLVKKKRFCLLLFIKDIITLKIMLI